MYASSIHLPIYVAGFRQLQQLILRHLFQRIMLKSVNKFCDIRLTWRCWSTFLLNLPSCRTLSCSHANFEDLRINGVNHGLYCVRLPGVTLDVSDFLNPHIHAVSGFLWPLHNASRNRSRNTCPVACKRQIHGFHSPHNDHDFISSLPYCQCRWGHPPSSIFSIDLEISNDIYYQLDTCVSMSLSLWMSIWNFWHGFPTWNIASRPHTMMIALGGASTTAVSSATTSRWPALLNHQLPLPYKKVWPVLLFKL